MKKRIYCIPVIFIIILLLGVSACQNSQTDAQSNRLSASEEKAKNIILLIGDGMGLAQVHAALTYNKGTLNIEKFPVVGLVKTNSADDYITDSAASGTALACGKKTKNGAIGVDTSGAPVTSILEHAEKNGLRSGLVSTSSITHATPAAFIAHQTSRHMYENIAADFLKTDIDVFIGGGSDHFTQREDKRNLLAELKKDGYKVLSSMDSLDHFQGDKLACLTAPGHNPRVSEGRGNMLDRSAKAALNLLSGKEEGFFLMIEGSQIDWGGHANDQDFVLEETIDFDNVVGNVLEFARKDGETLVVVTADHETGGMCVLNGNYEEGTVETTFATGGHTGIIVPLFAYGPGAEKFSGIYENTEVFDKMYNSYGF